MLFYGSRTSPPRLMAHYEYEEGALPRVKTLSFLPSTFMQWAEQQPDVPSAGVSTKFNSLWSDNDKP